MRRDDDRIRAMMMEMEADPSPLHFLDADDADELAYFHMRLLIDEGFMEEVGKAGGQFRMTSKGHDFVQAIRDDTIWSKTKSATAHVTGASLTILKDLALGMIRQKLIGAGYLLG